MKHFHLKYLFLLFVITGIQPLRAQHRSEPIDLVTMTNGYQLLGKIIEQRPGIDLKLYREIEKDTLTLVQDSIEKIAVVDMSRFAEKKVTPKDTVLQTGRFNTKKNVYAFSWNMDYNEMFPLRNIAMPDTVGYPDYTIVPSGLGFGYMRSIRNTFFVGGSMALLVKLQKSYFADETFSRYADFWASFKMMLEAKVRLSRRPQSKRFTALLGLAAGDQVIEYDRTWYEYTAISSNNGVPVMGYTTRPKMYLGGHVFTVQSSVTLKINPDNNSGFAIEPLVAFSRPMVSHTYINYEGQPGLTATINSRHKLTTLGLRIGYFF
jgi:hypothetical protein